MPVRAVVFDLDGTLIDGYGAIEEALSFAMTRLGLPPPASERVREMVGHGLEALLEKAVGRDDAPEGVRLFRERYPEVAIEGSRLLEGVEDTLRGLEEAGIRMSLASNKPPNFSSLILRAKGVDRYFDAIVGPDADHSPKPSPSLLYAAMASMASSPAGTVCVGDMEVDVEFARAGGCRAIVVPTGSRSREFLRSSGADLLIECLSDLQEALSRFD